MESPESYLPDTFPYEIYSLDDSIHPSRDTTSDHSMMDCLTSLNQRGKELELERHRLDNPGASPGQFPMLFLLKSKLAAAAAAAAEADVAAEAKAVAAVLMSQEAVLKALMERSYGSEGELLKKYMVAVREVTFEVEDLVDHFTRCVGTKTTLEFIPRGAKKAVLGMTQYNMLRPSENGDGLYLDEELSLCHIFPLEPKKPNGKRRRSGCAADQCKDFDPPPLCELKQEISKVDVTQYCPVGVDDYGVDVPIQVQPWDNFTKIYTQDPKLMYAACNHCNAMLKLKGGARCGTKSLINHSKSDNCRKKQQLDNASLMPTPSIVLDGHHGITADCFVEIVATR